MPNKQAAGPSRLVGVVEGALGYHMEHAVDLDPGAALPMVDDINGQPADLVVAPPSVDSLRRRFENAVQRRLISLLVSAGSFSFSGARNASTSADVFRHTEQQIK
jgi:hypothetical protein